MNQKIREIIEGFLPAMAKIQATNESDEQKKRNSKEWLRSKLVSLAKECEKARKYPRCETQYHSRSRPWEPLRPIPASSTRASDPSPSSLISTSCSERRTVEIADFVCRDAGKGAKAAAMAFYNTEGE